MKRIHIVGPPRTGTTLMLELLFTSFRIDGYAPQEVSVVEYPPREFRVLLTKNPRDHVLVESLLELDPEQWFIYMLRDPRDMLVSKHGRAPDRYWGNLEQWRAAWKSIAPVREHPRLKVVRYEDLVRDPNAVQAQLQQFLPFLEAKGRFSDFHERSKPSTQSLRAMRSLRPVNADSVGAWRAHKARVVGQMQRHGSLVQELIDAGYESDSSWLSELTGVEPDLSTGFWPDDSMAEELERRRRQLSMQLPGYLTRRGLR